MSKPNAREAILATAERLFAEQGMEAVSLRTINTAAGYSVAALHYHFSTREGLIEQLMLERQTPVLQRRETLLEHLQNDAAPSVHAIADALVLPFGELILNNHEQGLRTVKLFFHYRVAHTGQQHVQQMTVESYRIFDQLLAKALPECDSKTLKTRWAIASELALQGLANIDTVLQTRKTAPTRRNSQRYINELIDFIAAGLQATPRIQT